jgi:hypothetical protein
MTELGASTGGTDFPTRQASLIESDNTSSASTMRFISDCIERCEMNHGRVCKGISIQSSTPPTRILELFDDYVRLMEPVRSQTLRYVCLAHRWLSKDPHKDGVARSNSDSTALECCTLKDNIEQNRKRIAIADLLPAYRDAIRVTRALGLRYLWIDSLCIIQDDDEDKALQISTMGTIYSNSYLTIAADCNGDHTKSFFSSRRWGWRAQKESMLKWNDIPQAVYFRERPSHEHLSWDGIFTRAW